LESKLLHVVVLNVLKENIIRESLVVVVVIWLLASAHTQRIACKKAASPSENSLQESRITIRMDSMHVTQPNKQQI
jgi:hypothetical protein